MVSVNWARWPAVVGVEVFVTSGHERTSAKKTRKKERKIWGFGCVRGITKENLEVTKNDLSMRQEVERMREKNRRKRWKVKENGKGKDSRRRQEERKGKREEIGREKKKKRRDNERQGEA